MSKLVVFLIKDKADYEKSVILSKKIISYCLSKNLGVTFNFLGYSQELIHQLNPTLYFSISDDFLQLNSEYLNTSKIVHIEEDIGKKIFCDNFSFFDEIYSILVDLKFNNISLLISSDGSAEKIEDFKVINSESKPITEAIYESIINNKETYAYDFPDIIVNIGK